MSIPKIIHYCWFGGKPLPANCKKAIDTWKKHLPDYEIMVWDETSFDVTVCEYVKAAYDAGKYAFVSDYARLYALKTYGGIYLDTDIEVLRSFDALLKGYNAVFGFESEEKVMTAFMAVHPDHPIIGEFLDYYANRTFDPAHLEPNTVLLTEILSRRGLELCNKTQHLDEDTVVFTLDYFQAYDFSKASLLVTESTYTIHRCFGSWCSPKERLSFRVKRALGKLLSEDAYSKLKDIKKKLTGETPMTRQEIINALVKAAFIVLVVKVMASLSHVMPWNEVIDNLCVIFAVGVTLVKLYQYPLKKRTHLIPAAIGLTVLLTCLLMRQFDMAITLITLCLLIDEDVDEYIWLMFKVQAALLVGHVVISGLWSCFGGEVFFWGMTGERVRFNGGFTHANVLSSYTLSCMLMFAWKYFQRITPKMFVAMAGVTVLAFVLTRSRTGLILQVFLLLVLILAQKKSRPLEKTVDSILVPLFPVLAVLVFLLQLLFVADNGIAVFLDNLLTGRIKYAAYAYERSGLAIIPRYLDYAAAGVVAWTRDWGLTTFTFDNLYSFMFIQMGIIWIGLITVLIAAVHKKADLKLKIMMLIWVLFAMVEVHGLNCLKFCPLIFISTLLPKKGAINEPK